MKRLTNKLKYKLTKKLKQNNGFTISELLIATLILLLTSGMLVICIHLGLKQLYKQTQDSEAQMLCTMLSTAVQDELTYASQASVVDTAAGQLVLFNREGMTDPAGFYIGVENSHDDFDYSAVTDDKTYARANLGKIYLASVDGSNNITDTYGLVSTGAYNIQNSSDGSLQAGMSLKPYDVGYEVRIDVYNGTDLTKSLAHKEFYVGRVSADVSAQMDVDTSADNQTYNLIFDPNHGIFEDNTNVAKSYSGIVNGTVFNTPTVTRQHYNFIGWKDDKGNVVAAGGSVTVSRDAIYTAQWKGEPHTVHFYQDRDKTIDIGTISAEYGRIIGGMSEGQTIDWFGKQGVDPYNYNRLQKTGYEFIGWVDPDNPNYINDIENGIYPDNPAYVYNIERGDTWTVTKNQDFVAYYKPITYTARFYRTYDSNGQPTDLLGEVSVDRDSYLTLMAAPTPSVAGRTFKGWRYERAVNDNVVIDPSQTTFLYSYARDIDFVATWDDYTITFYNGQTKIGQALYNLNSNEYDFNDPITAEELRHDDGDRWVFNGFYSNPVNGVRDYDENGVATDQNTLLAAFTSGQTNVDLYVGWTNANYIYKKTDAINRVGMRFLIVGGDNLGDNQKVMTNNGGSVTTADVTIKGDSLLRYVDYNNLDETNDWYTSYSTSNGYYIRKYLFEDEGWLITRLRYKYLDLDGGYYNHNPRVESDERDKFADCRTWTYSNNELHGYYNTSWGSDWYVYYNSSDQKFTGREESGNGFIHIYELVDPGTVTSFNGYVAN